MEYPKPNKLIFCPDCGTKTLEGYQGFTYHHCLKCGYFFKVDRDLLKPIKNKSCFMDNMRVIVLTNGD